jgi:hypothetical protein
VSCGYKSIYKKIYKNVNYLYFRMFLMSFVKL